MITYFNSRKFGSKEKNVELFCCFFLKLILWVDFFLREFCISFLRSINLNLLCFYFHKMSIILKKSHPVPFLRSQGGGGDFFFGGNISFR